jgi:oxygen-independent coproporphyrinogen-3 oxidase
MIETIEEPKAVFATTRDGVRLAMLRFARPDTRFAPVLLTHGTFSNASICTRFADYLRAAGFDTWVFEWRGHGASDAGTTEADYEHLADYDVEAATRFVLEQTGARELCFVGHSAGGVLPWMHLARTPSHASRFRGIASLAAQTTHAGRSFARNLALSTTIWVSRMFGRAPARLFRLGPNDETCAFMAQWARWNMDGRWVGAGGLDYLERLATLRVPALILAAAGDRFIAPLAGCRQLFDALGTSEKTFIHCGKADGFSEDYTHGRIIASKGAQAEIWPRVATWLETLHSTPKVSELQT